MPGKQMAIDADLNAGMITDKEARERRSDIAREADFYGAMDGASKFVRGDATAAVLITGINLVGGIVDRPAAPAPELQRRRSSTYSILTVGDGLAAQIPALLISVATGIIVTRTASERDLGSEIAKQILSQRKATLVAGGVITRVRAGAGPAEDPVPADRRSAAGDRARVRATACRTSFLDPEPEPPKPPELPAGDKVAARHGAEGASDRRARARRRLRPGAAGRPPRRRHAGAARVDDPAPDRRRARHGDPAGADPRRGRPRLARVRVQGARLGGRARQGHGRPPAGDGPGRRRRQAAGHRRRPSRRSACRRSGSIRACTPRPRRSATRSSTANR